MRRGHRNAATIAPRVRREVLARDRHRCQGPGCGRTRFLEVHHVVPRERGGTNASANLVTLCAACHRLWHERGAGAVADLAEG
ncbi:MAG: HNH endonuclease [Candidatus Krumholzibacteriia bacterium]